MYYIAKIKKEKFPSGELYGRTKEIMTYKPLVVGNSYVHLQGTSGGIWKILSCEERKDPWEEMDLCLQQGSGEKTAAGR